MRATKRPFEEEWPQLAAVLRARLGRLRLPSHLIDDVIQETGLKLLKVWDQVDPARSVTGLTFTIANNALWEERRRNARLELTASVPEPAADLDVERVGIARLELKRVQRAMDALDAAHRSVLLAEIGHGTLPARSPDAIKMLRMRARKRLALILEGASASAIAIVGDMKRLLWRLSSLASRRDTMTMFEMPSGAAMVALCGAVAVLVTASGAFSSPPQDIALAAGGSPPLQSHPSDLWPTDRLLGASGRAATGGEAPTRRMPPKGQQDGYAVQVTDKGPVRGDADVRTSEDEDGGDIDAPDCSVERTDEYKFTVSCRIDTGEDETTVSATVEARP